MSNVPYYKASYLQCHTQRLIAAEMNPVFLLNSSTGIKTLLRALFPLSITSHQYLNSAASGMQQREDLLHLLLQLGQSSPLGH